LSESEQLEEVTIKKRKLQLKDRMEDIMRRYRHAARRPRPGVIARGGAVASALTSFRPHAAAAAHANRPHRFPI